MASRLDVITFVITPPRTSRRTHVTPHTSQCSYCLICNITHARMHAHARKKYDASPPSRFRLHRDASSPHTATPPRRHGQEEIQRLVERARRRPRGLAPAHSRCRRTRNRRARRVVFGAVPAARARTRAHGGARERVRRDKARKGSRDACARCRER